MPVKQHGLWVAFHFRKNITSVGIISEGNVAFREDSQTVLTFGLKSVAVSKQGASP